MTTGDFTTAARAEAQRAYQDTGMPRYDLAVHMAVWARDHLAADIREAQADAWDACADAAYMDEYEMYHGPNPYRTEQNHE